MQRANASADGTPVDLPAFTEPFGGELPPHAATNTAKPTAAITTTTTTTVRAVAGDASGGWRLQRVPSWPTILGRGVDIANRTVVTNHAPARSHLHHTTVRLRPDPVGSVSTPLSDC
jgi:hypothetical protein